MKKEKEDKEEVKVPAKKTKKEPETFRFPAFSV